MRGGQHPTKHAVYAACEVRACFFFFLVETALSCLSVSLALGSCCLCAQALSQTCPVHVRV